MICETLCYHQKFPKFEEIHKHTIPRISRQPSRKKPKMIHRETVTPWGKIPEQNNFETKIGKKE